jgi:membrane fusion protein (multidrug efflux system)
LRVFVSVPQEYSDVLVPGLKATLTLPQNPEKQIPAQFLTTAKAVKPGSRTIVTELTLDNPNHDLWPGAYVNVHFTFPGDAGLLIVPEQALLFRSEGTQVALVGPNDRIHLQNVTLGRNLGTDVEILSGLQASDKFVANPSLGLLEGQRVKTVQPVQGYQPGDKGSPPRSSNSSSGRSAATGPAESNTVAALDAPRPNDGSIR